MAMYLAINQVFIVLRAAAFSARGPGLVRRPTLGPLLSCHQRPLRGSQGTRGYLQQFLSRFLRQPPATSAVGADYLQQQCLLFTGVRDFDRVKAAMWLELQTKVREDFTLLAY